MCAAALDNHKEMGEPANERMEQNQEAGHELTLDDNYERSRETDSTKRSHYKEAMVVDSDRLSSENGSAHSSSSDSGGDSQEEAEHKEEDSLLYQQGEGHTETLVDVKTTFDSIVESADTVDSSSCKLVYSSEAATEKPANYYGIGPVVTDELVQRHKEVPISQPSSDEADALQGLLPDAVPGAISAADHASPAENSQEPSAENVEISSELPLNAAPVPVASSDGYSQGSRNAPASSLIARRLQPSSWKSCCGLFEVLRRSS